MQVKRGCRTPRFEHPGSRRPWSGSPVKRRVFTAFLCAGAHSLSVFDARSPRVLCRAGSEHFVDSDKVFDIFFLGMVVGACFAIALLRKMGYRKPPENEASIAAPENSKQKPHRGQP